MKPLGMKKKRERRKLIVFCNTVDKALLGYYLITVSWVDWKLLDLIYILKSTSWHNAKISFQTYLAGSWETDLRFIVRTLASSNIETRS